MYDCYLSSGCVSQIKGFKAISNTEHQNDRQHNLFIKLSERYSDIINHAMISEILSSFAEYMVEDAGIGRSLYLCCKAKTFKTTPLAVPR